MKALVLVFLVYIKGAIELMAHLAFEYFESAFSKVMLWGSKRTKKVMAEENKHPAQY